MKASSSAKRSMVVQETVRFLLMSAVFMVVVSIASADQAGTYVGSAECSACHEGITKSWEKTGHARAFQSLKKTSQENLAGCQLCHVTAFDEPGGFVDQELTPELMNVQCEECHGPGKLHSTDPSKKGSILGKVPEAKCRKCHTPGQDKNFNYSKKIKLIH
jgi:hypothetical protein